MVPLIIQAELILACSWDVCVTYVNPVTVLLHWGCLCLPAGEENCSRTLLQPSVMMNDCFPTRLHSVSLETEHLNTLASSPGNKGRGWEELGKHETYPPQKR